MNHQPPPCGQCAHRAYGLTCEDYDRLFDRAQGVCEICGIRGEDTPWGRLHVDHEGGLGWQHAQVRGLLCSPCNTRLGQAPHRLDQEAMTAYMARPYFKGSYKPQGRWLRKKDRPSSVSTA